jgi:hypothetical protein
MFTRIGIVGAWLALIGGGLRLATAIYVASIEDPAHAAILKARYLGSKPVGDIIDGAITVIVFAVAIGILTEISRSIRRQG